MTDSTVIAEWQAKLARLAHGLDLDTGEGVNEFRYQAGRALQDAPLNSLVALALAVGAGHEPHDEYEARRVILANWTAAATGLGTDRDINAGTHCPRCRSPYRREPARTESLWIAHNVCPDSDCGFVASVRDEHGRIIVETPPAAPSNTRWQVDARRGWMPSETRVERLARRIAPHGWYRDRPAPPLSRAVADRVHLEWASLDLIGETRDLLHQLRTDPRLHDAALMVRELPGDIATAVHQDLMPALDRAGWRATYFLASRAHRGAARLHRTVAALQSAVGEVSVWASYGVDDRQEEKDAVAALTDLELECGKPDTCGGRVVRLGGDINGGEI